MDPGSGGLVEITTKSLPRLKFRLYPASLFIPFWPVLVLPSQFHAGVDSGGYSNLSYQLVLGFLGSQVTCSVASGLWGMMFAVLCSRQLPARPPNIKPLIGLIFLFYFLISFPAEVIYPVSLRKAP